MDRIEKLRAKMSAAEEIDERLQGLKSDEDKLALIMEGGVQVLETIIGTVMGAHKGLDDSLKAGEIKDKDYQLIKPYLVTDLNILMKSLKGTQAEVPRCKIRMEAYDRVAILLSKYFKEKDKRIAEVEAQREENEENAEEDDQKRQKRIEARKRRAAAEGEKEDEPDNGVEESGPDTEGVPGESADLPPEAVRGSESAEEPSTESPEPEPSEDPQKSTCSHCGEEIDHPTGSTLCSACVSYKQRFHNRLPPRRVLNERRKRKKLKDANP